MSYASPKSKSKRPGGATPHAPHAYGVHSPNTESFYAQSPQSKSSRRTSLLSSIHPHDSTPKSTSTRHSKYSQATLQPASHVSHPGSSTAYSPRAHEAPVHRIPRSRAGSMSASHSAPQLSYNPGMDPHSAPRVPHPGSFGAPYGSPQATQYGSGPEIPYGAGQAANYYNPPPPPQTARPAVYATGAMVWGEAPGGRWCTIMEATPTAHPQMLTMGLQAYGGGTLAEVEEEEEEEEAARHYGYDRMYGRGHR
ncbi:hypothetical protein Hypma_003960 [Hypsizygus marmoreus]|uniref:Uncharacterized protein n=1 Tax=Hypsizygus marmoreus TaxID=39966 RepID=A0A369J8D5_HYPMA|nr:hypothetical protein Hypma_003960 [Hypsizygus marmoreus]